MFIHYFPCKIVSNAITSSFKKSRNTAKKPVFCITNTFIKSNRIKSTNKLNKLSFDLHFKMRKLNHFISTFYLENVLYFTKNKFDAKKK